jgi:hypothetical protein
MRKALKLEDPLALLQVFAFWLAGSLLERAESRAEHLLGPDEHGVAEGLLSKLRAAGDDSVFEEGFDLFGAEEAARSLARAYPLTADEEWELTRLCERWRPPSPADDLSDKVTRLAEAIMRERTPRYLLGWRDITGVEKIRTAIASVIPLAGVGHTFPLMSADHPARLQAALAGNLDSLVYDYVARQKVGGTHLTFGYLKQFPTLLPDAYSQADLDYIVPRVLELTYTAWDLQPFAEDLGYEGPSFPFDPERRHRLKCELDAYYARLYGLTRDELRYILDPADPLGPEYPSETFRVLKNSEIKQFGEYRTQRLVLQSFDDLPP